MADKQTLARPYAQAIFDLARETNTLEQWSHALAAGREFAANADVMAIVNRPTISEADQIGLLSSLAASLGDTYVFGDASGEGLNVLKLLIENDRIAVLPEIADHYETLKSEIEQTVDATVTSAVELSEDSLAKIRDALAKRLGQHVSLSTAIDPDLIGGAVISAGDFVIDGSVKTRLARLANALTH
ncbi:MAG: F0F1 ATP synthase subunit delta [Pseudomonadota bacterium]